MKKEVIKSIIFGFFVFVLGFGVMWLFWTFGEYPSELLGLFSYYSSGIGDSIFLPIMSANFLLYFCISNYELTKRQKSITFFGGIIGLLSGIVLQASWLINPEIGLNWTIPKPHYFNMAGWYHAFFLVLMFAFTAYSLVRWVITLHYKNNHNLNDAIVSSLVWGSGAGFVYTFVIDNVKNLSYKMELLLMYMVLGVFILVFFAVLAISLFQKNIPYPVKSLLMYVTCTLCSVAIFLGGIYSYIYAYKIDVLFGIIAFLLSFSYLTPSHEDVRTQIFKRLFIVIPTFTLTLALTTYQTLLHLIIVGIINILIIGFLANFQFQDYRNSNFENKKIIKLNIQFGSAFMISTLAMIYVVNHNEYKGMLSLLVSIIIEIIGLHTVRNYFSFIKKNEKDQIERTQELQRIKVHVFTTIIALFFGATIVLLLSIEQNTEELMNTVLYFHRLDTTSIDCLLLILLSIFLIMLYSKVFKIPKKVNRNYILIWFLILPLILYVSFIVFIISYTKPLYTFNRLSVLAVFKYFSKFCMSIGTAFLISEGFYSNALLIYSKINKFMALSLSVIIGIGVFICNFIILFSNKIEMSLYNGNHHFIIFYVLISICTYSILPSIIGYMINLNNQEEVSVTLVQYQQTLFVDGILYLLIFSFAGLMLDLFDYIIHSYINEFLFIISIFGLFINILLTCLKNNVEHFSERKENAIKIYENNFDKKQIIDYKINILARHLKIQNFMCFFAMLIYSTVVVFYVIGKEYWQRNDNEDTYFEDVFKTLKKQYWPND